MELLLLLVAVIDVPLEMSLGSKALAAASVWALVIFTMVPLVVSVPWVSSGENCTI